MPLTCRAAGGSATTEQLTVRLLSDPTAIQPGSDFRLGLKFQMRPGWHVYWLNPGAAGLPTSVTWHLPPELSAQSIQWPKPEKIRGPGVALYGYTGEVLLPIPLHATSRLRVGKRAEISGDIAWTVCREICVPGKATLNLGLPTTKTGQQNSLYSAAFEAARNAMPHMAPTSWTVSARADGEDIVLEVRTGSAGQRAEFYPFAADVIDDAAEQELSPTTDGFKLRLTQSQFVTKLPAELQGLLVMTSGEAFALDVPLKASSPSPSSLSSVPVLKAQPQSALVGSGLIMWFAFLGGLILNLMPCVLPVLSLKILSLASAAHEDASRVRQHGLFYLLGILVSFWILASILVALRLAGQQIGWGFQMQSPIVVMCLAALMFLIALNLLGEFEIGGSWMGVGSSLAERRSGRVGAFFAGVLATVVATPCTAPFMGVAIGLALTQPVCSVFLTFSSLALGLAAPYVLLTLRPQWARILPKPGVWMIRFRQALAFPMLSAVIWLVWVFAQQQGINAAGLLLSSLLMLSITVWVLTDFKWGIVRNVTAVIAFALAVVLPLSVVGHTQTQGRPGSAAALGSNNAGDLQWEAYSPEKLRQYRAALRPVMVDFTAAWCVTCLITERTVLRSAEIRKRLTEQQVALLKADWTSYDANISDALKQFGRAGVPFYLLYGRSDTPLVATEALSPGLLLGALDKLRQQTSTTTVAVRLDKSFNR